MADKNPEVLVCDASIMKNVWEIRLREHGQRMKLEQERLEKSALKRINEDWAQRMSGKVKPRRVERKVNLPEVSPAQKYKAKQVALGRPSGFVSSQPQKPVHVKKDVTKRNKLTLLLGLNEKQPGLMVWTKSWKFSQALAQTEQISPASDWGQSWKFLNVQPNNEGKTWTEHEHDTNNITYNCVEFPWEKVDKALSAQNVEEDISVPDWDKSWKYTNQRKESGRGSGRNGPKNLGQEKLHMLHQFHCCKEEKPSSEWNESWKSAKPPKEELIQFLSESMSKEESNVKNEEQSTIAWNHSWKYFKRQLHKKAKSTKTSTPPGWMDSWRISKPVSQISQLEKISNISEHPIIIPEEPLDPKAYQTIINASKEEKYRMLWSLQFQAKDICLPVTQWEKSWMTIKNLSKYKEQPIEKPRKEKTKLQEIKQEGFDGSPVKHDFDVFSFPKKDKPVEMLEVLNHKNKEAFISGWKDSWKSLKNHCRENRVQNRQRRMSPTPQVATPQTLTEWANSWRFTNLNANQDSNLWNQGWSTYAQNRPDRWATANEMRNEEVPCNGPAGARGWGESWRSTRHQHRVEREATRSTRPSSEPVDTQIHRQERSLADWEQSWQFSTSQFHQDRPSTTEWADSWRFCSFHCENWAAHQPEVNQHEKSMEIKARKDLHYPLHRFSRLFQPQTSMERPPTQEWKNSWKIISDRKKKPKSGQTEFPQSWQGSWMFSTTQLYKSERTESLSIHDLSVGTAQYESVSEWGQLWKIANPQPPKSIVLWSKAQPNTCSPQHMVFCSQSKCNNYLLSLLAKDYASLRKWGEAWRFIKLEGKFDMKSVLSQLKHEDDSVIMSKTKKTNLHMYSHMNNEAPQVRRWGDACKLAKTQPCPKRDARQKLGQGKSESDKAMFAEWTGSWRFVTDSVSAEAVKMLVSLTDWDDSWKFLLSTYAPQNGPKKTKGRS